jgi:hypothetical protein
LIIVDFTTGLPTISLQEINAAGKTNAFNSKRIYIGRTGQIKDKLPNNSELLKGYFAIINR